MSEAPAAAAPEAAAGYAAAKAAEPTGAFGKDKQYGNRLDQMFAIGEPFLLLGAIPDGTVPTRFGDSPSVKILAQKINQDTGVPKGAPFTCSTVISSIVDKLLGHPANPDAKPTPIEAAEGITPEELAAGPICCLQIVDSKTYGTKATVLQWIRNLADADTFAEFGLDAGAISRVGDQARPVGERLPL